ncbi:unnamed protein product [Protopolystoma xenopodis]|uniref:polynucleotide adenylyltransferase n=1 Tax=Protopolystoma xenopodis TaxID=117903 RepID=A0A3S5A760_9PLAT|nr:unnamed protein product [Protopolystoma xenopodis]
MDHGLLLYIGSQLDFDTEQSSTVIGASCVGSDVDAVLLVPHFVEHEDFFSSFIQTLKDLNVEDLLGVPETLVPLIKMKFEGIVIDMAMSRLNSSTVPVPLDFNQPPEELYFGVDHASIRGLSGVHLARELRELVPCYPSFIQLIKAIKLWVSRRAIGQYVYGFPSSIAWTIMAAYICKKVHSKVRLAFMNVSHVNLYYFGLHYARKNMGL